MNQSQKGLSCICGKPAFSKGLCKACCGAKYRKDTQGAASKRWHAAHPDYQRRWARRRRAHCTTQQFQQAWERQQGCCGICGLPILEEPRADHNHVTKKFRGLLHNQCNLALGQFHEDIQLLEKAIAYLKSYS